MSESKLQVNHGLPRIVWLAPKEFCAGHGDYRQVLAEVEAADVERGYSWAKGATRFIEASAIAPLVRWLERLYKLNGYQDLREFLDSLPPEIRGAK